MTSLNLLDSMAVLRPELASMVAIIESRAPYGALLLSARQGMIIEVDEREEQVTERPPTAGTVITAFDGVTMREVALGGFDKKAVERSAREIIDGVTFANDLKFAYGPEIKREYVTPMEVPPDTLSTQEKLDRCRQLQNRLEKLDDRIVNAKVIYIESSELTVFGNRNADLAQRVQRLRLQLFVVVAGPDGVRYDWVSKSVTGGWEALTYTDEDLQEVVDNAISLLSAERIEPGEYTVITSPSVTGTICHESFGHGVETDMFLKDRARAASYIDKPVGSSVVNIQDDPGVPGAYGSYFFDDEGKLAQPTQIMKEGIFRRGITDLYSSSALGVPRSANGRRQDYRRKAYARMSNTFFESGDTPVSDLFQQVDKGVYLEKWRSGMEDPKGWGIQVTCHFGHEIKNGEVTKRMFAPIGVSGYVPDVFQGIIAMGDDWALDGGNCGKGHKENAAVSSGGPHMLLKARLG